MYQRSCDQLGTTGFVRSSLGFMRSRVAHLPMSMVRAYDPAAKQDQRGYQSTRQKTEETLNV